MVWSKCSSDQVNCTKSVLPTVKPGGGSVMVWGQTVGSYSLLYSKNSCSITGSVHVSPNTIVCWEPPPISIPLGNRACVINRGHCTTWEKSIVARWRTPCASAVFVCCKYLLFLCPQFDKPMGWYNRLCDCSHWRASCARMTSDLVFRSLVLVEMQHVWQLERVSLQDGGKALWGSPTWWPTQTHL